MFSKCLLTEFPIYFFFTENQIGTVHEIRVTPCPEAANQEPCVLIKGRNATIEIDFTPSKKNSLKLQKHILDKCILL